MPIINREGRRGTYNFYFVDFSQIKEQGTNLAAALKNAIGRFYDQDEKSKRGRAIVLLSDGEDDSSPFQEWADYAKEKGIKIITVGIGSAKGGFIPESTDDIEKIRYKTFQGKKVTSTLNEEPLKEIAKINEGIYVRAEKTHDFDSIQNELNTLQKKTITIPNSTQKQELYPYFITLILILLCIELFWNIRSLFFKKSKKLHI